MRSSGWGMRHGQHTTCITIEHSYYYISFSVCNRGTLQGNRRPPRSVRPAAGVLAEGCPAGQVGGW